MIKQTKSSPTISTPDFSLSSEEKSPSNDLLPMENDLLPMVACSLLLDSLLFFYCGPQDLHLRTPRPPPRNKDLLPISPARRRALLRRHKESTPSTLTDLPLPTPTSHREATHYST